MIAKKNYFCSLDQITPHVPDDLKQRTESDWIQCSKNGDFVPVFRFGNGVYFRKSAVLAWAEKRFGADRADLIASMQAAGFEPSD
jgi:hypothetical protein